MPRSTTSLILSSRGSRRTSTDALYRPCRGRARAADRLAAIEASTVESRPLPAPRWPDDGIELHPAQQRVLESDARFIVACAGARGGKTVVGGRKFCLKVWLDHQRALAAGRRFIPVAGADGVPEPLLRYWVGAPSYSLTAVAQQELTKVFAASGWQARWEGLSGGIHHRCWLGNTGILVEFKSGEKPGSLVSVPTHGQWWDEGAKLKPATWHGNARQRLTDTGGWAIFTSTPMGPGFYQELFALGAGTDSRWYDPTQANDEWRSEHWTTADNPHPLVAADVESARKTLPKRYFDREYLASFDAYAGQVYEVSDIQALYRERSDEMWTRAIGGVDFGHGAPGCALRVLVRDQWISGQHEPHYHVADEVYEPRMLTSEWTARAGDLARHGRPEVEIYFCDPANPAAAADWRSAGLPASTHPRLNAVAQGIRHVATLVGTGRLTISPRCVNLRREMAAYRYHETSSGGSTDTPVKENDHACDALRYALWGDRLANAA